MIWYPVSISDKTSYRKISCREVLKPWDWQFKLSHRFEISQALWQHCCRGAFQISEWSYNFKYKSCSFKTARSYNKTSYWILKWSPGYMAIMWLSHLSSSFGTPKTIGCLLISAQSISSHQCCHGDMTYQCMCMHSKSIGNRNESCSKDIYLNKTYILRS